MKRRVTLISAMLLCVWMLPGGCGREEMAAGRAAYRIDGDTVRVTDEGWERCLRIVEAEEVDYAKEIVTAGRVLPIPTRYANIAPPFAGRVVRSYAGIGRTVREGEPIFEIVCPDFTAAQKEYFQAKAARDLARKELWRKEDLLRNGVAAQRELEEAQNTRLIAEKDFENARAALEVYQVGELGSMRLGQPLVVRSPIAGSLIEDNIVNGLYLREDAEPIAVVADLSKVWVSAQVKEGDIRFIEPGDSLGIEVMALPGAVIGGVVCHVREAVDEATRSIRVLSECRNEAGKLKLGMYATVRFRGKCRRMVRVPETAILQGIKGNFVYVRRDAGVFVRRDVEVETVAGGWAVVAAGIEPGERIVGEGGYYLK